MDFNIFSSTVIGRTHIQSQIPCQDDSISGTAGNCGFAVVSDGHGSRRHFRSERGSVFMCEAARSIFEEIAGNHSVIFDFSSPESMESAVFQLKTDILKGWREYVLNDLSEYPVTGDEMEVQKKILTDSQFSDFTEGKNPFIPYGCTVCLVFRLEKGWIALQLGDGSFAKVDTAHNLSWPMPESFLNSGNRTASACMEDPMIDFRHIWGTDEPEALLVYTDGLEKPLPDRSNACLSFLQWTLQNLKKENHAANLEATLRRITEKNIYGDDLSIAGIVSSGSDFSDLKCEKAVLKKDLAGQKSRIRELTSTLQYLEKQFILAGNADLKRQYKEIISRKISELNDASDLLREMKKEYVSREDAKETDERDYFTDEIIRKGLFLISNDYYMITEEDPFSDDEPVTEEDDSDDIFSDGNPDD